MIKTIHIMSALLALAAGAAQAHVTLADPQAQAGADYVSAFRVGHGCDGSATTTLRVEIPPVIVMAKPQPKPGWAIQIERAPLPAPPKGDGGKTMSERVAAITWRGGPLPDEDWDQFGIMAKLPDAPGVLYFPAIQTCERGEARWTEVPVAGDIRRLSHPAPALTVTPRRAADPMANMPGMEPGR